MKNFTKLAITALTMSVLSGCGGVDSPSSSSHVDSGNYSSDNKTAGVDLRSLRLDYQDSYNIILSWDAVEGANSYEVHVARDMFLVNTTYPITVNEPKVNIGDYVFQKNGEYWISIKAEGSNNSALTSVTVTDEGATF